MKKKLLAGIAALFTSTAGMAAADGAIRLNLMAQSNHSNTFEGNILRHPSEIMCDIVAIDPGFTNMRVDPRGNSYVMTDVAEDGKRYIIHEVSASDLAHDQRLFIQFAEDIGQPLHQNEIERRLSVAELFDALEESLSEYRPPQQTGPRCNNGIS